MLRFWTFSLPFLVTWSLRSHAGAAIPTGKAAPDKAGQSWLNSKPLTIAQLQGPVVPVEF